MIIDDYAYYLLQANLQSSGPGVALKIARATGMASPLIAGVYGAANLLALGALVILDPADLRGRERRAGTRWTEPATQQEAMQFAGQMKDLYQYTPQNNSGMIKDENGIIEIV